MRRIRPLVLLALLALTGDLRAEIPARVPQVSENSLRLAPGVDLGMWVWHREDVATADERARLLRFCHTYGINRLLVQAHYDRVGEGYALAMPESYGALLDACAAAGIVVEALDAGGESVFAEARANTLALLRAILAFNQTRPASARFAGLHLDFEPYTTDRWRAGDTAAIAREFVETAKLVRDTVRASDPALTVAYDIPFWFDQDQLAVEFAGARKPLSQHIQDHADYIGIMSYRTRATGPNSAADISADELAYGAKINRPVYLSLETVPLPETPTITFHGRAPADYVATIRELAAFRAKNPARGGILLHYYRTVRSLLESANPPPPGS